MAKRNESKAKLGLDLSSVESTLEKVISERSNLGSVEELSYFGNLVDELRRSIDTAIGRDPLDPRNPVVIFSGNFENYAQNFENYAQNFENYAQNFENYAQNFENYAQTGQSSEFASDEGFEGRSMTEIRLESQVRVNDKGTLPNGKPVPSDR